jgi:hypothetical protein
VANCNQCNTFMLFGGVERDGQRFCSENCAQLGQLTALAQGIPERDIRAAVWQTYKGECPCCNGPGPVDVRLSYRVFSALVVTRWSTHPKVACRSCGIKAQLLSILFCAVLGWWGFPWGILATPVQILRNLFGMLSGDSGTPSDNLDRMLRLHLAARMAEVPPAPELAVPKAS